MKKALRTLNLVYYITFLLAVVAAGIGYLLVRKYGISVNPLSDMGRNLSYIVILYVIISIPLSLWLFNKKVKQLKKQDDESGKLQKYTQYAVWRIVVMGLGLFLGVLFFYVLQERSLMFCAGMSAIGLVFCKPTEAKIITETEKDLEEKQ